MNQKTSFTSTQPWTPAPLLPLTGAHQGLQTLYVALEGVKGTGKSTLLKTLKAQLTSEGVEVILLQPTAPAPWWYVSELLGRVPFIKHLDQLVERRYAARSAYTSAQAAQRLQALAMSDAPHKPVVLLGDRSFFTSLVTRWERCEQVGVSQHWLNTRALEPSIPLPELVLYLELPVSELMTRLAKRARTYGVRDEGKARLLAAKRAYQALMSGVMAHHCPTRWVKLNAQHQDLSEQALALIKGQLTRQRAAFLSPLTHNISSMCS